jgi:uncharacterized phage protein gp47/JayE
MAITINPETGISVEDTAQIRQSIVDDWNKVFSDEEATLNTESESPAGQIIDSMAVLVTAKDSELVNLFNQFDPRVASGIFQDALGSIYFLTRKVAEPTVVTCQLTGLQGTVVPAGSMIQNDDGYKLVSVGPVTINNEGLGEVEFRTVETGPIAIGAGTCNKIVTVIAGWDTVTNAAAGALGQDLETRQAFEKRRALSVAYNSHGSRLALQSALSAVSGVLDCLVLENKTNSSVTKNGVTIDPHSVAICVYGGADEAIAECIYNKIDAGCGTVGETQVEYISSDNVKNTFNVIRPAATNIYVEVTLNKTASTQSTVIEDVQNAIYNDFYGNDPNSGNTRRKCGSIIYASSFSIAIVKTANVSDLVSIYIGRSQPAENNAVTMDADEEPVIELDNIVVNVVGE